MSKLDQSLIMAKYNRRKNRQAGLSSNPPSLSISLLSRSTLVQRREESSHHQTLAFALSMNNEQGMPPPGARVPAYIAPSNERGPLYQTDLNRTVFLDPQRRWSIILEAEPHWFLQQGGCPRGEGRCPRGEGGRPAPRPARHPVRSHGFWSLLDDRKLPHTLKSLCKPNVWSFPPYSLLTPCRNRQTPKLMEFCQIKP